MSVKDTNRIPELLKQLKSLDERQIRLGIVAPSGDKLYMIGWVHEFGIDIEVTDKMRAWFFAQGIPLKKETKKITIPERAYFRTGWDKNKSKIEQRAKELTIELLNGKKTAFKVREELGEFAAERIRENVEEVGLVDTGSLRDAIGYRVVKPKKKAKK